MSRLCSIINTRNCTFVIPKYNMRTITNPSAVKILDLDSLGLDDSITSIEFYRDTLLNNNMVNLRGHVSFDFLENMIFRFSYNIDRDCIIPALQQSINKLKDLLLEINLDQFNKQKRIYCKYISRSKVPALKIFSNNYDQDEFVDFKSKFTKFDSLDINELLFRVHYKFKKQKYWFERITKDRYSSHRGHMVYFKDVDFVNFSPTTFYRNYSDLKEKNLIENETEVNTFKLMAYLLSKIKGQSRLDEFICDFEKQLLI